METIDIREKLNTDTEVILNRFAEDVFFEIRMLDTWYKEVKRFVDENYLIHKENYEDLYRHFHSGNIPVRLDQLDTQSLTTILQFFPPIKEFYKKTSGKSANESFEKTIKDIGTLKNTLALYDANYDKDGTKLYFMQFNQLMNLQRLAVMCVEHFEEKQHWIEILEWTIANVLEQKSKLN